MDALSNVLRMLGLTGGVFLDASFRCPWCIQSKVTQEDCGVDGERASTLVAFHYVVEGRVDISLAQVSQCHHCRAGDVIILPRNDAHLMGSDLSLVPQNADDLIRKTGQHALARIDFGTERLVTRLVCGYIASIASSHPLLAALPPALVVSLRATPSGEWVDSAFRYAAQACAMQSAGMQETLSRLSELLFIEAIRDYLAQLTPDARGWLAALADPALRKALSALHADIASPWTTEKLAAEARLSRSAFAERFTSVVGVPPMTYLMQQRICAACIKLKDSNASLCRIAAEVGYESESTFSRAFTREVGMPPGSYRRTHLHA